MKISLTKEEIKRIVLEHFNMRMGTPTFNYVDAEIWSDVWTLTTKSEWEAEKVRQAELLQKYTEQKEASNG
jgi:hypothetical protein